ncbi:MAG: sce7726 family protein [Actinobacteria bacterium]|nr:sce7726 family protein [Actinomycetota bacterium]
MKATAKTVLDRLSPIAAASAGERPVLVEEFWVPESHERADLVAVAGEIWAFEIKSPRDSLARLPRQAAAFSRLFDRCVAVLATAHLGPGMKRVPPWWGVIDAGERDDDRLEWIRQPGPNPEVDLELLVKLLWKEEALAVAAELGIETSARASRHALWRRLLRDASPASLKVCVRSAVAGRNGSSARIPTRHWTTTRASPA